MEINSYQTDFLGYALCNPIFTTPRGYEWVRCWSPSQQEARKLMRDGIQYENNRYQDVEQAYQMLKGKVLEVNPTNYLNRFNLMVNLMKAKFEQYPRLFEQVKDKGGIKFLETCTHQPTSKNSYWETGGENGFIRALTAAYAQLI